jgi:hypothetical protein
MNRYAELLDSMTVGNHTQYENNEMTIEQAHLLLIAASIRLHLKPLTELNADGSNLKDVSYQGYKYYAFIGGFPRPHVSICNVAGTVLLHSITTIEELEQVPVLTPPNNDNPIFSAIAAALVGVPEKSYTQLHNEKIYAKIVAALKK